jgi:hypothetical protein
VSHSRRVRRASPALASAALLQRPDKEAGKVIAVFDEQPVIATLLKATVPTLPAKCSPASHVSADRGSARSSLQLLSERPVHVVAQQTRPFGANLLAKPSARRIASEEFRPRLEDTTPSCVSKLRIGEKPAD